MLALLAVVLLAWRAGDLLQAGMGMSAVLVLFGRQGRRYRQGLAMLQAERAVPAPQAVLVMAGGVSVMAVIGLVELLGGA